MCCKFLLLPFKCESQSGPENQTEREISSHCDKKSANNVGGKYTWILLLNLLSYLMSQNDFWQILGYFKWLCFRSLATTTYYTHHYGLTASKLPYPEKKSMDGKETFFFFLPLKLLVAKLFYESSLKKGQCRKIFYRQQIYCKPVLQCIL